jgi:hypothetical protein
MNRTVVKYAPFITSAMLMWLILYVIYPHYQYYIDPDGTAYLTISTRRYTVGHKWLLEPVELLAYCITDQFYGACYTCVGGGKCPGRDRLFVGIAVFVYKIPVGFTVAMVVLRYPGTISLLCSLCAVLRRFVGVFLPPGGTADNARREFC